MATSFNNKKGNLKGFLFIVGIALIISGIWYSHRLVDELEKKTTEYVKFRIKVFESAINNPNNAADQNFLFNEVIQGNDYPIIYTDVNYVPKFWKNIPHKFNSESEYSISKSDSIALAKELKLMSEENIPIPIKIDSIVLGYYYYGYSPVIYKLRVFPYIAIGAAVVFILIGYLGFSYIKKSEEQFIWVGMAKETAHQLGTPLSSIAGWLELIKINPQKSLSLITDIENDLNRLNKIANRFSKIGSIPELTYYSISKVIDNVAEYFRRRLPNTQKKIVIETEYINEAKVKINPELFEWVLENLIKNAMDAIGGKGNGKILIKLKTNHDKNYAYIDVHDNGKGMTPIQKKNIFNPGYSTKKRGWGLGLSLAKRIIEEYHGGKLILKDTKINSGTIFRIIIGIN